MRHYAGRPDAVKQRDAKHTAAFHAAMQKQQHQDERARHTKLRELKEANKGTVTDPRFAYFSRDE